MEGNCCYFISHGAHLQGDTEEGPCLSGSFKDQSWTNLVLQVSVNFHSFFISIYLWECESHNSRSSNLLLSTFKFLVTQLGIWCNLINVLNDLHQTFSFSFFGWRCSFMSCLCTLFKVYRVFNVLINLPLLSFISLGFFYLNVIDGFIYFLNWAMSSG
jgi:hypothetical protein